MNERIQPDEVLDRAALTIPDGAVITSAVLVIEYVVPSEDPDGDDYGPMLYIHRDDVSGVWKHLGMIEALASDIRSLLREEDDE